MNQSDFTEQDKVTIAEMFDSALRHILEGDFFGWAQLYAEDCIFQPPNSPTVAGRQELETWGKAFPVETMNWSNVQVSGDGNIAYGTSSYELTFNDGTEDTGKQLAVFRRTNGEMWEVVAVSFNSNLPAAHA